MIGPKFNEADARLLENILQQRRDVRGNRFHSDPLPDEIIERILMAAMHAPSVGLSQPWEFIVVSDRAVRQRVRDSFDIKNAEAATCFTGARAEHYKQLKLDGILESALNIAVFYSPLSEPVLGQTAMSEVGRYSCVCAIQNMWLMARSLNVGMGWVSILDPDKVKEILKAPDACELVGYLCLGYVDEFYDEPELQRLQWAKRKRLTSVVHYERFNGR